MNNSYPDSFRLNCVGKIPCNNNFNVCENKNNKSPMIIENDQLIDEKKNKNKSYNNISNISNRNITDKAALSTTTHCLPYSTPNKVIQTNKINFKPTDNKSWSNQRGYGNILVATYDRENNIKGSVHPYHRIYPLKQPYDGPADIYNAWRMSKIDLKRK
jgi:hypothetical protein